MAAKIRFIAKRILTLLSSLAINDAGDLLEINDDGDTLEL
jgi:hypothetical protein